MNARIAVCLLFVLAAACSGDKSGEHNNSNGWQLGDDAGNDGGANSTANNGTSNNTGGPNNATNNVANNGTTANNGTNGTSNNQSSNNVTNGSNNFTMGNGGGAQNDVCAINSDCQTDLVCCPGLNAAATCQQACIGGGLCNGNDAECGMGRECCDLSGINQPDACLRACPGQGTGGTPCANNTECPMTEVCCLRLNGQGECTTDCLSGGACAADADCRNNQVCCDIRVAMVCLDQCF